MISKKYDIITIDKDLSVVVEKVAPVNEKGIAPRWKRLGGYEYFPVCDRKDGWKVIASIGKQLEGLPLVVLPEEKHSLLLRIADRIDEMAWAENTSMFDTYIKEIREYATQQKGTIVAVTLSLQDNKIIEQDGKINPISITYERIVERHTGT